MSKRKANELIENGQPDVVATQSLSKAKKTTATAVSRTALNRVGRRGMCLLIYFYKFLFPVNSDRIT